MYLPKCSQIFTINFIDHVEVKISTFYFRNAMRGLLHHLVTLMKEMQRKQNK